MDNRIQKIESTAFKIQVQLYCESRHGAPEYAHLFDSGMDIKALLPNEDDVLRIQSNQTVIVPTGLYVALPPGCEFQVRPRSGLSYKTGLRIANSIGTIDSPYRGELGIIIHNIGAEFVVRDGDKIAQLVLAPVFICEWQMCDTKDALASTDRGIGGFGSTGVSG